MGNKADKGGVSESLPQPGWWSNAWDVLTAPKFVYRLSFFAGLFLILAYLCIPLFTGSGPNWALSLVKELGFAYVIAAILGFSIEDFNKRRHLQLEGSRQADLQLQADHLIKLIEKEHAERTETFANKIARDVIEAAYGATVPKPVLQAFTKFVLQAKRIRHDFKVDIDLYRLDEVRESEGHRYEDAQERARDSNRVLLTYTSRWTDENVTAESLDMHVPVEIIKEGSAHANFGGLKLFQASLIGDGHVQLIDADSVAALERQQIEVLDSAKELNFEFVARAVPTRSKASFVLQIQIVQDLEDEISVMSLPPCVEATLKVRHSRLFGITVSSIHSEPEIKLAREPQWHRDEHQWKLATALLPSQGFVLNWAPAALIEERPGPA